MQSCATLLKVRTAHRSPAQGSPELNTSRHLKYLNLGWSRSQRRILLLFIMLLINPKTISEGCIISAGVLQGDVVYGGLSPCLAALPVLGFQVSVGSRSVSVEERARIKCRERSASLMRQEGGTRCWAWPWLPGSSPCLTEPGVLQLFWALLYRASASICINRDPNLALFCSSLVHNQHCVAEAGFTSALFIVCPCALVLQVMFLLNFPCATQRQVPAATSFFSSQDEAVIL